VCSIMTDLHIRLKDPLMNKHATSTVYPLKQRISSAAIERTSNTGVRFVTHFERHDKPWMNRRVRSISVWLQANITIN
jgi:hypothetical protein